MNIIVFIADSLTFKNANKISFADKCQVKFNNHWANATWTLPSMASLFTGRIPTTLDPVYGDKPHKILPEVAQNIDLWKNLYGKYYMIFSTPWDMIAELFYPIHNIFGVTMMKTNSPYINYLDKLKGDGYYARRFKRRLGIDLIKIPKPFFHIYHNTRTHSEYGLSPNEFIYEMQKGPEYLEKAQEKQIQLLDIELNEIYNSVPNDTLIIFTSDHGEDFDIICKTQECGHAVNYTDDILHIPLMLCYKGNKEKFKNQEIDNLSCNLDLHNQLNAWILNDKEEFLPFNESNKKEIIFTQGSKIGEESIKFLKDIKIGIKDFKNNVLYTQSMVDEKEEISKEISYEKRDRYRLLVSQKSQAKNKDFKWETEKIGLKAPHDEF